MGWSIGYDSDWQRDIGYGVPALCDHPGCSKKIDRGLFYVCGGDAYGGEHGCGLYFCAAHLYFTGDKKGQRCERCVDDKEPFTAKPDVPRWIRHKLKHSSWAQWRSEKPRRSGRDDRSNRAKH